MKYLVYALCSFAAMYLAFHLVIFSMNAEYRHRMENPAYVAGESRVTYYSVSSLFN